MSFPVLAAPADLALLGGRVAEVELGLWALRGSSSELVAATSWQARAATHYRLAATAWADDLAVVAAAVGSLADDLSALARCGPAPP